MTDGTEAPAPKKKSGGWGNMTPEQRAARIEKMQSARKKPPVVVPAPETPAAVKVESAAPPTPPSNPPSRDPGAAELAALRAELAAKEAALAEKTELLRKLQEPIDTTVLPQEECYFEFIADRRGDMGEIVGEVIHSHTDSRFDEIERRGIQTVGSIVVNKLIYDARGEVVARRQVRGTQTKGARAARTMLQNYALTGDPDRAAPNAEIHMAGSR